MIYVMTCGCRLKKSELKKTNKLSNCCPKHREAGRIKYIEKKCADCSTTILLLPTQTKRERCPDCLIIHKKKIQQKVNQRRLELRKNQRKEYLQNKKAILAKRRDISAKAWDCIHRDECLYKAKADDQYLPCYKCTKYCPLMVDLFSNTIAAPSIIGASL